MRATGAFAFSMIWHADPARGASEQSTHSGGKTMRSLVICLVLVVGSFAAGCDSNCGDGECLFTATEWNTVKTLSPLPDPPADPTNRFSQDPAAATLGHKLFVETRYSTALKVASTLGAVTETAKVGCVSCHLAPNFVDTRSSPNNLSVGVSWTTRNAPSLVNNVYYRWHNWHGGRSTLWDQASFSPETGTNTAGDRCGYAHMLWDLYREEYNAVFADTPLSDRLAKDSADPIPMKCKPKSSATAADGPWELFAAADEAAGRAPDFTQNTVLQIMCNQGKAVAAFESQLVSRNAPFDQYIAGDEGAISEQAKRGLRLFVGKAACVNCHSGPFFSDQLFHNIGVAQTGPNVPATDQGRIDGIKEPPKSPCRPNGPFSDDPSVDWLDNLVQDDEADRGAFRTASLRNVANSAPYMHAGQLATLRDVLEYYNKGGDITGFSGVKSSRMRPLGLTESDIDALLAFLDTLTGEPIPSELTTSPMLPGTGGTGGAMGAGGRGGGGGAAGTTGGGGSAAGSGGSSATGGSGAGSGGSTGGGGSGGATP
jgi:cytochrome c peroxidase